MTLKTKQLLSIQETLLSLRIGIHKETHHRGNISQRHEESYKKGYTHNSSQSTTTSSPDFTTGFDSSEYSQALYNDSSSTTTEKKYIAPVSRFEDMRSSAMQFWTTGVNLEFQPKEPTKAKNNNGWMTEQEFSTLTKSKDLPTKKKLDSLTKKTSEEETEEHHKKDTNNKPDISYAQVASKRLAVKKDEEAEDSSTSNTKTTTDTTTVMTVVTETSAAATADIATPTESTTSSSVPEDWYFSDTSSSQHFQHQSSSTGKYQSHPTGNSMINRHPAFNSPFPHSNKSRPFPVEQTEEDVNSFIFVYSVKNQLFGAQSLERFQKGVGSLLEKVKSMSHRTLDVMIRAMVYSIKEEQSTTLVPKVFPKLVRTVQRKVTVCDILGAHFPDFLVAIQSYIKTYMMSPKDFISILQLFHTFVVKFPDYADQIPLPSIRIRFDQFKQLFTENEIQQMRQLFSEIAALQKVDTWLTVDNLGHKDYNNSAPTDEYPETYNTSWILELWSPKKVLPHLPNGESLIQEVFGLSDSSVDKPNIKWQLPEEEEENIGLAHVFGSGEIASMVLTPWPKTKLDVYLATQYEILREIFCGPARHAIQKYSSSLELSGKDVAWLPYISDTQIYSTSLPATLVEPVAIFTFLGTNENIETLKTIRDGSLAILIPQTSKKRLTQKHLASISKQIITGIIVGSTYNARANNEPGAVHMIAIHLKIGSMMDLQRSAKYTILITSPNSSSIIPVLSWLRKEVSQCEGEMKQTEISSRLLSVGLNSQQHGEDSLSKNRDSFADNYGKSNPREEDTSDTPTYLQKVDLDISCIIQDSLSGNKAYMEKNVWPQLQHKHLWLPVSERPFLYTLSKSQLSALKYALFHRFTVISGGPGTGKTHLASKLVNLVHQGLVESRTFHPVIVITKNESTLDAILEKNLNGVSGMVRLGVRTDNKNIASRQGLHLFGSENNDQNQRYVVQMERRQAMLQADLDSLWKYRSSVLKGDLDIISTFVPPGYMHSLRQGCPFSDTTIGEGGSNGGGGGGNGIQTSSSILKTWMRNTDVPILDKSSDCQKEYSHETPFSNIEAEYDSFLKSMGSGEEDRLPLIIDSVTYKDRLEWIVQKRPNINSIANPSNWPLSGSQNVSVIRNEVLAIWSVTPPENMWKLLASQRKELWLKLINKIVHFIDSEITKCLEEQFKASRGLDKARLQKWAKVCQFNRLIGMTAEFAASNQELINSLSPSVVIVDEADQILESTMAHFLFGPRMDHLILLGDDTKLKAQKQKQTNGSVNKTSQHLDVSLFERWYLTGGKVVALQEQWRMCTEVLEVFNALDPDNDKAAFGPEHSETTANTRDKVVPALLGFDNRTFFVSHDSEVTSQFFDDSLTAAMGIDVTESMADGARYVCHLALYILQQGTKPENVAILAIDPLQKRIIEWLLENELLDFSQFVKKPIGVTVSMIDDHVGKENWIVIISLAVPHGKPLPDNNVSLALSRARYGLYIVGDAAATVGTKWELVAKYMRTKGNCSPNLQLRCQKHKERTTVISYWPVFNQVRNGGCTMACETLMECGHVCKNMCHILDHSYATCVEPCVRPRPDGCEHACPNSCNECSNNNGVCPPCTEVEVVKFPCGHQRSINCKQAQLKEPGNVGYIAEAMSLAVENPGIQNEDFQLFCTESCNSQLECGHMCQNMCRVPHSHDSSQCQASCPKQLICGHNCSNGCAKPNDHTEMCLEACQQVCSHGYKCGRDCWRVCTPCVENCPYSCIHKKCTRRCHEKCDRPPCDLSCSKILPCSHPCPGLCGELCPPCRECNSDMQCAISLRTLSEFDPDEKIYILPECKCIFSVEYLDMYFNNQAQNGEHNSIKLWQCPLCQTPIYTALRYNMYIKTEIALVNKIKESQNEKLQRISENEKQDIIKAMNDETRTGIHNIVGGRWFVCKNQHPYFIGDCGGATEVSTCPQCGETIGGLNHKVVDSNRFYGEFDGSNGPAWPGQPYK
ncbi:hypothetical protein F4703DRAFT_1940400 [Phycomyces blakesleeanus]